MNSTVNTARRRMVGALCLVLLALLLAGCDHTTPGLAGPGVAQVPFDLPHLHRLPALSRLTQRNGTRGGLILGVATRRRAGASSPQALITFIEDDLHLIGLDGTDDHRLHGDDCSDYNGAAVTADGRWVACVTEANGTFGLWLAALQVTSVAPGTTVRLPFGHVDSAPAWSPDSRLLAIAAGAGPVTGPTACDIDIFAWPSPHTGLPQVARLTSAAFADGGLCAVDTLGWSPDGAHLRALALRLHGASVLVDIPLAALLGPAAEATGGPAITAEVPASALRPLGQSGPFEQFDFAAQAWNPATGTLLYAADAVVGGRPVMVLGSLDPRAESLVGTTLLTLPDHRHRIARLAWTPAGDQALVIVDGPTCADCSVYYFSDVYLYTPLSA
jgi:hypothetical protein